MPNKILKNIFFSLTIISFSGIVFAIDLTDTQKALLESLPADQRDSILTKMKTAQGLEEELEETFETGKTVIEKPQKRLLTEEEKMEYSELSKNWIYGYELFDLAPTTFAPVSKIPIPVDFVLGPGDKLNIQYFGSVNTKEEVVISRSGVIDLPQIGPIGIAGLTLLEAQNKLMKLVSSSMIGTEVSLNISELRSITVYVLGEAYKPGSYTVSSLSSLTNALFVSGGVNERGSVRNIEIKRGGKTIHKYDLYDLIIKGDTSSDIRLRDGDVIFIPIIKSTARVEGSFRRATLFEVKDGDTIQDLVDFAGGYKTLVGPNPEIELSTIDYVTGQRLIKSIDSQNENLDLFKVKDGDSIKVTENFSLNSFSISLTGAFKKPGTYTVLEGDTLLDILEKAEGYSEGAYPLGAIFLRKEIAKEQKLSFERAANDMEQAIADALLGYIASGDVGGTLSAEALKPISLLINRLREEKPLGRMVISADPFEVKADPQLNFLLKDGDRIP